MLCEIVWNQNTLAVALTFSIPLAAIIGGIFYKMHKTTSDNELKARMVERGMSAEEIERVLAAKSSKD